VIGDAGLDILAADRSPIDVDGVCDGCLLHRRLVVEVGGPRLCAECAEVGDDG